MYSFDAAGNRTALAYWNGSATTTTNYTYNSLNQLISLSADYSRSYTYDLNGNVDYIEIDDNQDVDYVWTIDNRLVEVDNNGTVTQYAYDYQGARILRRDQDTTRMRSFFNGLTEEVVKESVAGAHSDSAFGLSLPEDGDSASEWCVPTGPGGATITSVEDTDRRSNVIKGSGQNNNSYMIGDDAAGTMNPNDAPWNETKRVLSFWYKGGFYALRVHLNAGGTAKILHYHGSSGTDYLDASGYVHLYLGNTVNTTTWKRFERNIESDWESLSPLAWQNTDGLQLFPKWTLDYDFYFDDIRFSNSKTVQFNALTGGSIGQIAAEYTLGDFPSKTVKWLHYDRLGNVMNKSGSAGTSTDTYHQDAYGNVLSNVNTGQWASASSFSGRHLTTKEYDNNAYLYYFHQRWYDPGVGRFISRDPLMQHLPFPAASLLTDSVRRQYINQYTYSLNNPLRYIDVNGGCADAGDDAGDDDNGPDGIEVTRPWNPTDPYTPPTVIILYPPDWVDDYCSCVAYVVDALGGQAAPGWVGPAAEAACAAAYPHID